jgi:hypothetical protein
MTLGIDATPINGTAAPTAMPPGAMSSTVSVRAGGGSRGGVYGGPSGKARLCSAMHTFKTVVAIASCGVRARATRARVWRARRVWHAFVFVYVCMCVCVCVCACVCVCVCVCGCV